MANINNQLFENLLNDDIEYSPRANSQKALKSKPSVSQIRGNRPTGYAAVLTA